MPLEIELRQVEGIEVNAYASENAGTVMVEFDPDYDLDQALLDTREAVDRAKVEFPSTAEEEPIIQRAVDKRLSHHSSQSSWRSTGAHALHLALDLRDQIEARPDVLSADLLGSREELLEAVINPRELKPTACRQSR